MGITIQNILQFAFCSHSFLFLNPPDEANYELMSGWAEAGTPGVTLWVDDDRQYVLALNMRPPISICLQSCSPPTACRSILGHRCIFTQQAFTGWPIFFSHISEEDKGSIRVFGQNCQAKFSYFNRALTQRSTNKKIKKHWKWGWLTRIL